MMLTFDSHGNTKQKEACKAWADPGVREILYGGSKGSGKTYLGISLIFSDALTYPGTRYFIARVTLDDLISYTIPSINEVFEHWGLNPKYYTYNATRHVYTLYNGSTVQLIYAKYEPKDPLYARFGSRQFTRGWIEEAGEFIRDAKVNLQAGIGRWKNDEYGIPGKLLMTCNPSPNFLLSEIYEIWRKGGLDPSIRFINALPSDNKMLPEGYVDELLRIYTPNQAKVYVYGLWEFSEVAEWLVSYDAISDMFHNDHVLPDKDNPLYSADLAMKGRDKFVGWHWLGNVAFLNIERGVSDGKEIENELRSETTKLGVPRSCVIVDSDGLGNYLESYFRGITEFKGNASSTDPKKYRNLKSECAYKLAEKINKRQIKVVCTAEVQERLKTELRALRAVHLDPNKPRQVLPKEEMKKILGGKSPDYMDGLIMGQMFDVVPRASGFNVLGY